MSKAEASVSKFYNSIGWKTEDGITEDARRFEDLREFSSDYVSKCRQRVSNFIPEKGDFILDMASGPIQYIEYLEYSKNFNKRYCVDLSSKALEMAKEKIGDHGVFLHGSFFEIPLSENFFDCTISLHTIYHIDKSQQEEAVRKLIFVTKPDSNIIIVYSNPNSIFQSLPFRIIPFIHRKTKNFINLFIKNEINSSIENEGFYFQPHSLKWWSRFNDVADVKIYPWRSFNTDFQKKYIPNNKFGKKILQILFNLENRFPKFFVKNLQYPMIVLTKKVN
jgi:ubiquinone/menaquinone biosynthesis C-methylase UbiE